MAIWTLANIRDKVRKVTGRLTSGEMSNTELDDRINKYYQYTFPAEVKLDRKHTYYEFLTSANQPWYDLPNATYTNFEPIAFIDNIDLFWYQDPSRFFIENPYNISRLTPWTGDGVTTAFATTVTQFPIMPDTLVITDNTETFEDTNKTWTTANIAITGNLGGSATINYSTGAINVGFNTAPANGQNIYLSFAQFNSGRPVAVLMYNNQFQFYPVPDTAYRFRVKAYAVVTPLVNATDQPELDQWGPCIAYGTARDIHADYGELEAYADVTALYKEQLSYVMTKTVQDLLNTRAMPNF